MVEQVRVLYDSVSIEWLQGPEHVEVGDSAAVVQCCFDRERPLPREDCEKTVIRAWTNYQVIYSTSTSVADAVCVNHVAGQHAAIVHRKILGAKREVQVRRDGDSVLLILEGGFPRGGENGADVHAPWGTLLQREQIPVQGHVIFVIPARVPSEPRAPVSAVTTQWLLARLPELLECIGKFLTPVELLRANSTCREWRQHRLLCGPDLAWRDAEGHQGPATDTHEVEKAESMAEREYVWLEACVPGGGEVEPLAALVKLDLKDQGWGNKKGVVMVRVPGASRRENLIVAHAEHHRKKTRLWGCLSPSSSESRAAEAEQQQSDGARPDVVIGPDGNPLQPVFSVHYHVGGGGGHRLSAKAQVACLVRVRGIATRAFGSGWV